MHYVHTIINLSTTQETSCLLVRGNYTHLPVFPLKYDSILSPSPLLAQKSRKISYNLIGGILQVWRGHLLGRDKNAHQRHHLHEAARPQHRPCGRALLLAQVCVRGALLHGHAAPHQHTQGHAGEGHKGNFFYSSDWKKARFLEKQILEKHVSHC